MDLTEGVIKTGVARSGMTLQEALGECVRNNVPGIPFVDEQGRLVGRFVIRHAFKQACLPLDLIKGAHLLGEKIYHLEMPREEVQEHLKQTIDSLILKDTVHLNSSSQILTALALMEKLNVNHLFIMEGEEYLGIVTRMSLSRVILENIQGKLRIPKSGCLGGSEEP